MRRWALLGGLGTCVLGAGCRPGAPDESSSPPSRAVVNPAQLVGHYASRTHDYSVRFVDDWTIDASDPDAVRGCAPQGDACIEVAPIAAASDDPERLLAAWSAQLAARLTDYRELSLAGDPPGALALPFLMYTFSDADGPRRAIAYLRLDGRPALVVTGSAAPERFAAYATGFKLTAESLRREP